MFSPNFTLYKNDDLDRLPPQNLEAEEAVLGGILLDPLAISRIFHLLTPNSFSLKAHGIIHQAALSLHSQQKPTDIMTVATWLQDNNQLEKVGGQSKLARLVDRAVSAVNIDQYAMLVAEKHLRRKLIQAGEEIKELAFASYRPIDLVIEESRQVVLDFRSPTEAAEEKQIGSKLAKKVKLTLDEFFPSAIAAPLKLIAKNFPLPETIPIHELLPIAASLVPPDSKVVIHKLTNREEFPIIRSVLVAESSNRKSAVEAIFLRPLEVLQEEERNIYEAEYKEWETKKQEWDTLPPDQRTPEKHPGQQPQMRIFSYNGGTKEAVWEIAERQPNKGILHAPDEILQVITARGEYKHGKGSDTESSLSSFNGRANTILRKGKVLCFRDKSCLIGGIQPSHLIALMGNDPEDSRGELARYLPCFFDLQQFPIYDDEDLTIDISGCLVGLYRKLDLLSPQTYTFTKEAKRLYSRWHNLCEKKRNLHPSKPIRAFIGKLEGYCAKLAMILHIIWSVCEGDYPDREIPLIQIQRAIKLSEFYYQQALRVHQLVGGSINVDPIKAFILERLRLEGNCTVRKLQASSRLFKTLKATDIYKHFQDLVETNPDQLALNRSKRGTLQLVLKDPNQPIEILFSDDVSAVSTSPEILSGWDFPTLTPPSAVVSNVSAENPESDRERTLTMLTFADTPVSIQNAHPERISGDVLTADTPPEKQNETGEIPPPTYLDGTIAQIGDRVIYPRLHQESKGTIENLKLSVLGAPKDPFQIWWATVKLAPGEMIDCNVQILVLDNGSDSPDDGGDRPAPPSDSGKDDGGEKPFNEMTLEEIFARDQALGDAETGGEAQAKNSDRDSVSGMAVSLWQPWASLLTTIDSSTGLPYKQFETRSWKTDYRCKLIIHAAKKQDSGLRGFCDRLAGELGTTIDFDNLPRGCAIATAELTDCVEMTEEFISQQSESEIACGDWNVGRYAWKFENVQPLPQPIPLKGQQGLWKVSLSIEENGPSSSEGAEFAVGDRVELTIALYEKDPGLQGTVQSIEGGIDVVWDSGQTGNYKKRSESWPFQKIAPSAEDEAGFAVGDRVKVLNKSFGHFGQITTVTAIQEHGWVVTELHVYHQSYLEKVTEISAPGAEDEAAVANSNPQIEDATPGAENWEVKGFRKGDRVRLKSRKFFKGEHHQWPFGWLTEYHYLPDFILFGIELPSGEIIRENEMELELDLPIDSLLGFRFGARVCADGKQGTLIGKTNSGLAKIMPDNATMDFLLGFKKVTSLAPENDKNPFFRAWGIFEAIGKGSRLRAGKHPDHLEEKCTNKVGVVASKRYCNGKFEAHTEDLKVFNLEAVKVL